MHIKNRHILVTGSHRSGTTWVGRTIAQHPQIRYIHEPFNVDHQNPHIRLALSKWFEHFESSRQKQEIRDAFNRLLDSNPFSQAYEKCRVKGFDVKTPLRFGKYLLSEYGTKPRVLIKDPIAILSAGWLYETYGLQVICMIRNPFAFVGSLKVAGWDFDFKDLMGQQKLMSEWLNEYADKIEAICSEEKKADFIDKASLLWNVIHSVMLTYQQQYPDWLFIKYEEIAANPAAVFQKIFDGLNLDMDDNTLNYIKKYTSEQNPKEAATTTYQPRNSKQSLHTWKERLSPEEIGRVRASTHEIASQLYKNLF
jgi:hypothetical protein